MDLHFTSAEPSADEQSAVDAALASVSPTDIRPRRTHLLPVLHAIQNRIGWISPGAVNYASRQLGVPPADTFGVADFYGLFSTRPQPPTVVYVCDDIACKLKGADTLCADLRKLRGLEGGSTDGQSTWHRGPCLGLCERAPAAMVRIAGPNHSDEPLGPVTPSRIVEAIGCAHPAQYKLRQSIPQFGSADLKLLRRVGHVDPASLDEFLQHGGFAGLQRALEMEPEDIIREVTVSRLVGRGGAAFPVGQKWSAVRSSPLPRLLVCNADESEPGTFKDRVILEGDPYSVIESMAIAAYATGCERGYLYIRGEYSLAAQRAIHAIERCRSRGFLGDNVLGRDLCFDIEVRIGAGAYICGEETALFNSIEGNRGEPRNKPPYPTQVGLFGRPTVINNVETLINLPRIVMEGGATFSMTGSGRSTGTKLFCLSGHIARPGVYEAAFGITIRQLLDLAGGVSGTGRLQCVLVGGAAGTFVGPANLDMPLTFEGARAADATLGSAVVMPFDDSVDMSQILLRIAAFFRDESCGQCVPCRVGTVRQEELLHRLAVGRPRGSRSTELVLLKEVGQAMRDASICGLGQTASSAIESALHRLQVFQDKG